MHRSKLLVRCALAAAVLPVVASAQTIVFQENFDGATGGTGRFDSFLAGGDGTFDANYDYSQFQYKLFPNPDDDQTFTSQAIPPAPGGTTTKGLRISVDDTTGLQSNLQLLPLAAGGGHVSVSNNFKIGFDMWINYNGPLGGGDDSTEHMATGLNKDGTGVVGFAPGGTPANGYLITATGEGGNPGDYRLYSSDTGDDGPTYEKVDANWTGTAEQAYDRTTGNLTGKGNVNPDEAQNSYFDSLFPAGQYETPGAPGKHWVHATIEQHGNAVDYSLNGQHVATLFLTDGAASGVPSFGFFDRNIGSAGVLEADQFMLYDNIVVTQFADSSKFTATSGNFSNPANWSAGVPSGSTQDAVFDGASGPVNVTISAPVTLRSLVFNSANSYTVGGTSTISLANETNDLIVNAGTHTVTAPVSVTGHMSVYNASGTTLTLTHLATDPTKFFSKTGGGTLAVNQVRAVGMTLTTGTLQLLPGGGVSRVKSLALSDSAPTLDLTNDTLIVDYDLRTQPGTSPLVTNDPLLNLKVALLTGFNGGDWKGPNGILSTLAASVAADSNNPHKTGIGYAESSDIVGPGGGSFGGESLDGTAVILKYALLGDANMDGKVNALDFNALATNYGSSFTPGSGSNNPTWAQGDWNYDGVVDSNDFVALGLNFGSTLSAPALGTLVPEPASCLGMVTVGLALARRKNRRRA